GGALNGKTVFMPGWTEREIIAGDDKATMWKLLPSVHFLVTDKIKAMVEFKRAQGTTAYQYTNRYRFKNIATNQYRAELKSDRWFVRAYQTQDFGEDSYDLSFTGTYMQTAVDPRTGTANRSYAQQYFGAYALAYNTFLANPANAGNTAGAEQAARAQAAPFQLMAGSPEFNALRKQIITDEMPGRGTQLNPSSFLSDLSTQYEWRSPVANGVIGGGYRQYRLGSNGQLFSDQDGKRIINDEYGIFTQLTKSAWKDKLKFMGAARLDGFQNFPQLFSPRVAMIYSAGKQEQHTFRASFGQAFRSPTQQGQYLQLDLQRLILLGNVNKGFQGYSTEIEGVLPTILSSQTPAEATLQAYEVNINNLKPERVATWEIGYKGQPAAKLTVDANFYISNYRDFIRQVRFIGNVDGSRPTPAQLAAAATGARPLQTGPTRVIQVQANAAQQVHASGSMASLTYRPRKQLNLTGNYTLSLLERKRLPERFQAYYNTPRHKFNLGAYGEVGKAFNYSLNYRWAEGHLYESPFATGQLENYSTLDADLGFRLPKQHTLLQVGGTNLLNSRNIQVYGGPQIGRLVYLGLTVEVK
ncbi:TonB-dependent receptor plug domain-containing protein, partial [Hymenobacter guriensis]